MTEYISAERTGKQHGECGKFEADCARSLFKLNKYSREANQPKQVQLEHFLSPKFSSPIGNDIM
jgi:hypothetical protein